MLNPIKMYRAYMKFLADLERMADELHVFVSTPPPWDRKTNDQEV